MLPRVRRRQRRWQYRAASRTDLHQLPFATSESVWNTLRPILSLTHPNAGVHVRCIRVIWAGRTELANDDSGRSHGADESGVLIAFGECFRIDVGLDDGPDGSDGSIGIATNCSAPIRRDHGGTYPSLNKEAPCTLRQSMARSMSKVSHGSEDAVSKLRSAESHIHTRYREDSRSDFTQAHFPLNHIILLDIIPRPRLELEILLAPRETIVSDWNDDLHCADQDFVVGCGQTGKREEGFRTSRRPPIQVHRSRSRP